MKKEGVNRDHISINDGPVSIKILSGMFGCLFFTAGIINTFWGNDPGFGIYILLLSLVYFLPLNEIMMNISGFKIPKLIFLKILPSIFIFWATMGVGELFYKIELMIHDF